MSGGVAVPALAGVVMAIGLFYRPGRTAAALLLFAPIIWGFGSADFDARGDSGLTLVAVVSGVLTLMSARWLLVKVDDPAAIWIRRAAIFYSLATFPSILVSPTFTRSAGGYLRLVCPVLFMFLVWHCSQRRYLKTVQLQAIALSTLCMCGMVGAAYYTGKNTYYMGGFYRLRAFNLPPQHISLYSVVLISVLTGGVLMAKHRARYVAGIVVLLLFTYQTGYRTAWVGIALVLATIMIVAVRSGLAKFAAIIVTIALTAFSGAIINSVTRYAPAGDAANGDMLNVITSGRVATDTIALRRYFTGNPKELLFGLGIFSSENVTLEGEGTGYIVHNDYLATLVECGFVGALGYLLLVAAIGRTLYVRMRTWPRRHPGRTLSAVAFACFVAFTVMGVPSALYTNVFIGCYYYGFLGIVLAQKPGPANGRSPEGLDREENAIGTSMPAFLT